MLCHDGRPKITIKSYRIDGFFPITFLCHHFGQHNNELLFQKLRQICGFTANDIILGITHGAIV